MRILVFHLLAVALLLFGATSASAYAISMTARGNIGRLNTSDVVIVDVFLDAEPGLTLLSVGVVYPGDGTVIYDGPASAALAVHSLANNGFGKATGAVQSYILHTPAGGEFPLAATVLYPSLDNDRSTPGRQSQYWTNWAGINQPGSRQVNLDYFELGFRQAPASGTNIYLGSLVFHIGPGFSGGSLALCVTCGGNTVNAGGMEMAAVTTLSAPITLPFNLPEPTTAVLFGLGLLGMAAVGRR